jgi:pescadillo protein
MVHLFAVLPITKCIKDQKIFLADLLCKQWQNYIVQKRALRKVFVSIKGIYYQAEVQGQKVTWLAPYTFVQKAPSSIDYQVMKNFLELYSTLLGFVLYKLYTTEGFRYPPVLDHTNYDNTAGLSGLKLENHHKIPRRPKKPNPEEATEEELKDVFHDVQIEKKQKKPKKGLFSSCHFYLTREVPRDSLEFVIRSFGGRISWDGCPWDITESHDSITHQILDRPSQSHIFLSRDYIQPQWVYDSVNAGLLLPVDEYSITSKLPPHLSPFVDDNAEGYVPDRRKKIEEMLASANRVASTKEIEAEKQRMLTQKEDEESGDDDEDDDDFPYFNEEDQEAAEAAERETQYLDELAAEEQGISYSQAQENAGTTTKRPKLTKKEKEDKINQRDRMFSEMMIPSRKKKRLWDKIQKGRQRKENRVQLLTDRKRKIEEDTSAPGASKSKRQKTGDNKANKSNKANKAKRYQPQPAAHLSKKQKTKA